MGGLVYPDILALGFSTFAGYSNWVTEIDDARGKTNADFRNVTFLESGIG